MPANSVELRGIANNSAVMRVYFLELGSLSHRAQER